VSGQFRTNRWSHSYAVSRQADPEENAYRKAAHRGEETTTMGTKGPAIGTRGNPRPVHVLPKDYALKDGETYEGWPCRACAYFITIDQSWPDAARISDAHYVVAVCPQCKTSRLGTWGGKERRQYVHAPANRPPP
jgi:hypothetical protein